MATRTFSFKTEAFKDYYNRNKADNSFLGVFEFLEIIENDPLYAKFQEKFSIMGYGLTYIGDATIHSFLIQRKQDINNIIIEPLQEEEIQFLVNTLGMEDENTTTRVYSTYFSHYVTIINED